MNDHIAQVAVPPRTVAETSEISTVRRADLLAIPNEESALRQTKTSGDVVNVQIRDGSKDQSGKDTKVVVFIFASSDKYEILVIGKPLVFLIWCVKLTLEARLKAQCSIIGKTFDCSESQLA